MHRIRHIHNVTLLGIEHFDSKSIVNNVFDAKQYDSVLIELNQENYNRIIDNNLESYESFDLLKYHTSKIELIDLNLSKELKYYSSQEKSIPVKCTKYRQKQDLLHIYSKYLIEKSYFNREIFISSSFYNTYILHREKFMYEHIKSKILSSNPDHLILVIVGLFHFRNLEKSILKLKKTINRRIYFYNYKSLYI